MSQQGLRQASVRAVTGTALDYNGDFMSLFTLDGITTGDFNGRMLAWLNLRLEAAYDNLPGAMAAFATANGATNFSAVGTFDALLFTPLSLFDGGVVGAWYDPSDLTTLFQDSAGTVPVTANNDPVGMMRDKSGNGNHAIQATAGSRPLYKTLGGKHWIEGDGANDFLRATFTITQPWERISGLQQVSWVSGDRIFGNVTASAAGFLFQAPTTPSLSINSGTTLACADTLAVGVNGVVTERHSGVTSRVAINSGNYTTGAANTNVPGGITIFSDNLGTSNANARLSGLVMRAGAMTTQQVVNMRAYLVAKM